MVDKLVAVQGYCPHMGTAHWSDLGSSKCKGTSCHAPWLLKKNCGMLPKWAKNGLWGFLAAFWALCHTNGFGLWQIVLCNSKFPVWKNISWLAPWLLKKMTFNPWSVPCGPQLPCRPHGGLYCAPGMWRCAVVDVWGVLYCNFVASTPRVHLGCLILPLSNPQGCNVVCHADPCPAWLQVAATHVWGRMGAGGIVGEWLGPLRCTLVA